MKIITKSNEITTLAMQLIDKLHSEHRLLASEYHTLLLCEDKEVLEYLRSLAQQVATKQFGNKIYLRGLIEVGNYCSNDCYYCGIRKSNDTVPRYRLSRQTILNCCQAGYELGFRTFVMQGGEDHTMTDSWITETIAAIRQKFPSCAITLSLGEHSKEAYQQFYNAGANRYLLRHETHNPTHYSKLHPEEMSLANRLACLNTLKEIGFQTGTGIMVGTPGQTVEHLIEDLLFIESLAPQMIGIGPFVPHHATPFKNEPAGSVSMTLKLLSIFRLMHPKALIPATTSLATLATDGRERGILAGANVVMPNLSPVEQRSKYSLYDNKASFGAEAAEGLERLTKQLAAIGYAPSSERGDFTQ
ncbi:MAG: [FeFe] hydrogenase H-cluster radical SAM maturase HydE [Phocaeicola sp.]